MLSPSQVNQVARNFIGHAATTPSLRESINAIVTAHEPDMNAQLAKAITDAIGSGFTVEAGDVDAIRNRVNALFASLPEEEDDRVGSFVFPPPGG